MLPHRAYSDKDRKLIRFQAELEDVENRLAPYWEKTKDVVLRPGVLGGFFGVRK